MSVSEFMFQFYVFACYLFGACQSFIITSYSTDLKTIFSYLLYTSLLDFFKRFKNSGTLSSCHQVAIFITPFLFVFNWCHFLLYDSKSFKTILPFFHAFILIENSISKTLFLTFLTTCIFPYYLFLLFSKWGA